MTKHSAPSATQEAVLIEQAEQDAQPETADLMAALDSSKPAIPTADELAELESDADAEILSRSGIAVTAEVAQFVNAWEVSPVMPASTRGVKEEYRALATLLLAHPDTPRRTPDVETMRKAAPVVGRLLSAEGYRLKQREAMFPTDDGTQRLFIVIQAVKRNPRPAK